MKKKSIKKTFLKGTLIAAIFTIVFFGVLSVVISTTHPQRFLNNFEKDTGIHEYLDNKDGFYFGELSGGKITGKGEYVLTTGSSYEGEWNSNEVPNGQGVLILKDIGRYEGGFYNGLREGTGTLVWDNGDSYTGEWIGDAITGTGTITYENGNTLYGSFSENQFISGDFTAKLDIGTLKISIDENGKEDAVLTLTDGTIYTGTLSNGKFNNECIITYANGDKYDGSVSNNLKSGYGTYTWDNGASYKGFWSNDKMNGSGTYYYTSSLYGKRLKGVFKDNIPTSSMTYYDEDGDDYTTTWSDGICTKVERN